MAAEYPVCITLPDLNTVTTTGDSYPATQNGLYTFEMLVDRESFTAIATVSRVDPTAPTASIREVPGHTPDKQYSQAVTLTVEATAQALLSGSPETGPKRKAATRYRPYLRAVAASIPPPVPM